MYNLKIIKSGDRIEIYKINNYLIKEGKEVPNPLEGFQDEEEIQVHLDDIIGDNAADDEQTEIRKQSNKDRKKTLNNARNNIIRLIKANEDMQTFITLTFAEEQDYKQSKKSLNIFFTKLRKSRPGIKYLWVLEYGDKNKRLHYHLLCNIPIAIKLSDSRHKKSIEHKQLEKEFAARYWQYGFVDIRNLKDEGNTNIALYVATYIVKSLEHVELEGYRVYGYSRKTLDKPQEIKLYTYDNIEEILGQYKDYEIAYANSYSIGYEDYKGNHKGTVSYFDMKLRK